MALMVVIFRIVIFEQVDRYLILVLAFSFDAFARMLMVRCPMMDIDLFALGRVSETVFKRYIQIWLRAASVDFGTRKATISD